MGLSQWIYWAGPERILQGILTKLCFKSSSSTKYRNLYHLQDTGWGATLILSIVHSHDLSPGTCHLSLAFKEVNSFFFLFLLSVRCYRLASKQWQGAVPPQLSHTHHCVQILKISILGTSQFFLSLSFAAPTSPCFVLQSYSHWLQWEEWMYRSVQIFTCAVTSSITEILKKVAQRYFKCKTFSYINLRQNIPFKCINYPWVEELDMMHYILSYVFLEYFSHLFMTRILFRNTVITEGWIVFWLQHHSTIYPT